MYKRFTNTCIGYTPAHILVLNTTVECMPHPLFWENKVLIFECFEITSLWRFLSRKDVIAFFDKTRAGSFGS